MLEQTTKRAAELGEIMDRAFALALDDVIAFDPRVLLIYGLSGLKYRLMINHIIKSLPDARYLEIGTWTGSTLCSAINGNRVTAVAVEDWSNDFENPSGYAKGELLRNLSKFQTSEADVSLIQKDFRAVDFTQIGKFNVFMYDGDHSEKNHYDAIRLALPALDDDFILIVDDWNSEGVRKATERAFMELRLLTQQNHFVFTCKDGFDRFGNWHNGYFFAVMTKFKHA